MRKLNLLLAMMVLEIVGCGAADENRPRSAESRFAKEAAVEPAQQAQPAAAATDAGGAAAQGAANGKSAPLPRKIIRTADLQLIVNDFDQAEQQLQHLISQCKDCYVAQADVGGAKGAPRHGRWKIRVPADRFDSFIAEVSQLGVPERNSVDSQEVTAEYYDLDTRIKNKKVEEARLLKQLENSTAKLEEILAVEREIARVRGEIEQQEGRLRMLANLTTLTTVTVTIQETKNYVPPQAPTFLSNVTSTFTNSLHALVTFGQNVALLIVALTPWLPLFALIGLPLWLFIRRRRSASRAVATN